MRIYLVLLFICIPIFLSAQATQFVIESFQLDLNDLEANRNPVLDANDKKCALIKIRTDLSDITFSSNNGIVEQKKVLTEYWVYVSFDEKRLNVYKEGFLPLNFDIPISLEESKVYTFYITTNKKYSIVIQTEPKDALISLDNTIAKSPNIANVIPGRHTLKIERDGFLTINDTINVDDGRIFFSYTMDKQEPQVVTITSDPTGSAIVINSEYKGQTPKQLFLYPGKYQLQLSKEFHEGVKEEITIINKAANNFNYTLYTNISYISVYTFPSDAQVFIDGNRALEKLKIEGGDHLVEVKRNLYYTEKKMVNIRGGIDTILTINLLPKLGNLQFTVNPIDANVQLYKDEKMINSWTGANRIEKMQIGIYTLIVDAKKYKKIERQIAIKENVTEDIFIDLGEKQTSDKGKLAAVGMSAVIPGLGQFYSGQKVKAGIYALTGLGAGAMFYYYNSQFNKTLNTYNNSITAYENSKLIEDIDKTRKEMDANYDKLKKIDKSRNIFVYSFAALYGINLIDAMISGGSKKQLIIGREFKNKNFFSIQPTNFYGGLGVQIKYRF